MSDRVPPRPDLPPDGVPVPEMPPTERPLATWRWWEAILVYLLILIVSAVATFPIFQVIRSRGLANLSASATHCPICQSKLPGMPRPWHNAELAWEVTLRSLALPLALRGNASRLLL